MVLLLLSATRKSRPRPRSENPCQWRAVGYLRPMPIFEDYAQKQLQRFHITQAEAEDVAATGEVTSEHYVSPFDGWEVREKTLEDGCRLSVTISNDDRITDLSLLGKQVREGPP